MTVLSVAVHLHGVILLHISMFNDQTCRLTLFLEFSLYFSGRTLVMYQHGRLGLASEGVYLWLLVFSDCLPYLLELLPFDHCFLNWSIHVLVMCQVESVTSRTGLDLVSSLCSQLHLLDFAKAGSVHWCFGGKFKSDVRVFVFY